MQSHPLRRTHFGQYQASSAALAGVPDLSMILVDPKSTVYPLGLFAKALDDNNLPNSKFLLTKFSKQYNCWGCFLVQCLGILKFKVEYSICFCNQAMLLGQAWVSPTPLFVLSWYVLDKILYLICTGQNHALFVLNMYWKKSCIF